MAPAPRLRQHLFRDEQSDLDSNSGEPDAFTAHLGGRGHIVVAGEVAAAHPSTIVHEGERALGGVRGDGQRCGTRVDRVGDDLGENGLLGGAWIGVAEVFEEVQEIDARFAHWVPQGGGFKVRSIYSVPTRNIKSLACSGASPPQPASGTACPRHFTGPAQSCRGGPGSINRRRLWGSSGRWSVFRIPAGLRSSSVRLSPDGDEATVLRHA